jgi:hypothetical protein
VCRRRDHHAPKRARAPLRDGAIADTIDARLAAPIELQLNDENGAPRANVAVSVTEPSAASATHVATALGGQYQSSVTATTDAAGHARVWAKLGMYVGREYLRASAGAAADSLGVDIRAGQPTSLGATPEDTAMWVGQTYRIRTLVHDRWDNPRTDAVSFAATGGVSVSSDGILSATAIGRAMVVASVAGVRDTIFTSVVPQATLAVYAETLRPERDGGIYVIRSDGSGGRWVFRFTVEDPAPPSGLWPTWSPDGTRLTFIHSRGLRLIGADGSGLRDLVMSGDPVSNGFAPQYAKDGWIYFSRVAGGGQVTSWRVRDDGTGLAQVSEQRAWGIEAMPTPNPSADVVAYQTNDITNGPIDFTLRFISLSTGVVRKLDLRGYSPRWSPIGDRIGYLNGPDRLNFLDANGVPLGEVGGRAVPLARGFSWSPDGAWIVGYAGYPSTGPVPVMVNTTSGLVLPMNFHGPDGQLLSQPSWQQSR